MAISIVRLGSPRASGEGLRIGTVRRPPRGVPKADWARRDFYDVWLPTLAPSEALLKVALSADTDAQWQAFKRRYLAEMKTPTSHDFSTRSLRCRITARSRSVAIARTKRAAIVRRCASCSRSAARESSADCLSR